MHNSWYFSFNYVSIFDGANSCRCTGQDHVTFLQGEVLGNVAYQVWNTANHFARIVLLSQLAIDLADKFDVLRISNDILTDKVTDGTRCVKALGQLPRMPFSLEVVLQIISY